MKRLITGSTAKRGGKRLLPHHNPASGEVLAEVAAGGEAESIRPWRQQKRLSQSGPTCR